MIAEGPSRQPIRLFRTATVCAKIRAMDVPSASDATLAARLQPPGTVQFSTAVFRDGPDLLDDAFVTGDRIFWRARFASPLGRIRLDLVTIRCHADGWEEVVSGHTMWVAHPGLPGYSGWIGPGAYDGPGSYVLRVVRDDVILAEGAFEIVDADARTVVH